MTEAIYIDACDQHHTRPHRHGGKGTRGERGNQGSFAFGCILLSTFNAYRDINDIYTP